jgi:hypothetical protein
MNEQVMISRELLERMRDLIYALAHREDSIGQDACSVGGHFPELLAQPVSDQPAGEVPVQWTGNSDADLALILLDRIDAPDDEARITQLEQIVMRMAKSLQARAVLMPERKTKADYYVYIDEFANEAAAIANAVLDEVERLNGNGGV